VRKSWKGNSRVLWDRKLKCRNVPCLLFDKQKNGVLKRLIKEGQLDVDNPNQVRATGRIFELDGTGWDGKMWVTRV